MAISDIVELARHKAEKSLYMDGQIPVLKTEDLKSILADLEASIDVLIDKCLNPPDDQQNIVLSDGTVLQSTLMVEEVLEAINDHRYLAKGIWDSKEFVKYLRAKYEDDKCIIEVIKYGKGLIGEPQT